MSLEKAVEALIKETMGRGEFHQRRGQGKPVDLTTYFKMPVGLRLAYTALKNAGMAPEEVELLQETSSLK